MSGATDSKRAIWLEIAAVLFFIYAPAISYFCCALLWGREYEQLVKERRQSERCTAAAFDASTLEHTIIELRLVPIVLFVIWRSGEGWSRFGLVKPKLKDILLGLGIWLLVAACDYLISLAFHRRHPCYSFTPDAVSAIRSLLLLLPTFRISGLSFLEIFVR